MSAYEVRKERIEPLWDRVDRNRLRLALFVVLRVGLRQSEGHLPFGSWMIVGATTIGLAWLHAREIIDTETWDRKTVAPIAVVFGMLWAGHASMVESLCHRRSGPALPLADGDAYG